MRIFLPLIIMSMVAGAIPATAQQRLQPASAQHVELTDFVAEPTRRGWRARSHHRTFKHAARLRGNDICSIINGWRAFPVRTRYSYFNTGRIPCHR